MAGTLKEDVWLNWQILSNSLPSFPGQFVPGWLFKITGRVQLTQAGPAAKWPITTLGDTAQKVVAEIHCLAEVKILGDRKNIDTVIDDALSLPTCSALH